MMDLHVIQQNSDYFYTLKDRSLYFIFFINSTHKKVINKKDKIQYNT